ncbi:MAG: TRAP transporter substrate-binding protein DctP [Proteobacteria bacterium]|nr:TRAP transporter substrate-binding protein DctP [Pseudomonadota bacterium]
MSQRLSRRLVVGAAAATLAAPALGRGASPVKIRCSLDTAPSHPRNQAIVDYMATLEKASNGEIKTEVFHSGQLFADLNVSKALLQGQIEMASPGTWVVTGLVPDADLVGLPYFYGVPIWLTHKATAGAPGDYVNKQLEAKLKSHVLGPWLDLGYNNWYSTRTPLTAFDSLKGLKIRSAGGAANSWRIKFAGGIANTTAWPNVPLSLSQGTFDALISSDESVNSAKLWEAGVKFSYVDNQFLAQYIPMVSNATWAKLSKAHQTLMTDLWASHIDGYDKGSIASQARARGILEQNGVTFHDAAASELSTTRKAMIDAVGPLIKDAKLSPEIVRLVKETVG